MRVSEFGSRVAGSGGFCSSGFKDLYLRRTPHPGIVTAEIIGVAGGYSYVFSEYVPYPYYATIRILSYTTHLVELALLSVQLGSGDPYKTDPTP